LRGFHDSEQQLYVITMNKQTSLDTFEIVDMTIGPYPYETEMDKKQIDKIAKKYQRNGWIVTRNPYSPGKVSNKHIQKIRLLLSK